MDRDASRILRATQHEDGAPLPNLTFVAGDFLDISGQYDAILSVASVHYAAAEGRGAEVLRALASAMAPRGTLIVLVPRRADDQPIWKVLPRPQGWPVFSVADLQAAATRAGLRVNEVQGLFGSWCVLAKQAVLWAGPSRTRRLATLPVEVLVRLLPFDLRCRAGAPSYALMLVASRPPGSC